MSANSFDAEIKVRLSKSQKRALEKAAAAEDLKTANIVRRAIGQYLAKQETAAK